MAERPCPEFDKAMAEWNRSMARWRDAFKDFGQALERAQHPWTSRFTRLFARPTRAAQLADARQELLFSERARSILKGQFEHYIDQAIRARNERDRAEVGFREMTEQRAHAQACLTQALAEKQDLVARVLYLEREQEDLLRSRDNFRDIADGLRHELKAGKAKKKGRT